MRIVFKPWRKRYEYSITIILSNPCSKMQLNEGLEAASKNIIIM